MTGASSVISHREAAFLDDLDTCRHTHPPVKGCGEEFVPSKRGSPTEVQSAGAMLNPGEGLLRGAMGEGSSIRTWAVAVEVVTSGLTSDVEDLLLEQLAYVKATIESDGDFHIVRMEALAPDAGRACLYAERRVEQVLKVFGTSDFQVIGSTADGFEH
jgi:hypothetical protein